MPAPKADQVPGHALDAHCEHAWDVEDRALADSAAIDIGIKCGTLTYCSDLGSAKTDPSDDLTARNAGHDNLPHRSQA